MGTPLGSLVVPPGIDQLHGVASPPGYGRKGISFGFSHPLKGERACFSCRLPLGDPVEGPSEQLFPPGEKVGQFGDHHLLQLRIGNGPFDVAVVGVRTDNGFGPAVVADVPKVVGRIDGRDGNGYGARPLDAQPGNDPVDAVGDVHHDLFPFFYAMVF